MDQDSDVQRRELLRLAAGLGAAAGAAGAAAATTATGSGSGNPGDFDFLSGEWKIRNRRWKDEAWDLFDGEATVHGILGGVASIEELRIPARQFAGMGLRLLDLERRRWADYWVNARSGVLGGEPAWGGFVDGVGTWDSEEGEGAQRVIARGVWDRITPRSCRWYQAISRDGGRTWQETWTMDWQRA